MNFDPSSYNELTVTESPIPGLFVVKLPVHGDNRGWFKENYQKEKMEALGLPKFTIVQNNISFNDKAGATRGLHAEPWNKFISTAICEKAKTSVVYLRMRSIREQQSSYRKASLTAIKRLTTTSLTPILLTRTGRRTRSIRSSTYSIQSLALTGQSRKKTRLFPVKTLLIRY